MSKKIDTGSMVVGYVHPKNVEGEFPQRIGMICLDRRNDIRAIYAASNADHAVARNVIVEALLKSRAEYLLWVDDDATFASDAPAQLLHQAVKEGATRAHGYSFGHDPATDVVFGGAWEWKGDGWNPMEITGENMWVDGVGCHFQLIHREVYEALGPDPHLNHGKHPATGKQMGQDLALCYDALQLGLGQVLYTPHVQTGHIKTWEITYADYLRNHAEMEYTT